MDDATPSAVGENIAAPRPVNARLRRTVFRSWATALIALPATKIPRATRQHLEECRRQQGCRFPSQASEGQNEPVENS